MSKLKEKLMLSEKGYSDLKKAITACTITNIALLLPSMVACLLFWELLKPFTGETISWVALWKLLGLGVAAAILVFLAAKNDYRKTYGNTTQKSRRDTARSDIIRPWINR